MEALDLTKHDPEEYMGKTVRCHGGEYFVGPHLGTGAERIVHRLINQRSGLAMLVIRILRQSRPTGVVPSITAKLRRNPELASIVTIAHEAEIPGGIIELQPYAGGGPPVRDPCGDDLSAGSNALNLHDYAAAVTHYQHALGRNPAHTMALINLAAALREQGDVVQASSLARQAVRIEPNLFLYRQALVTYTAQTSSARLALTDFEEMRSVFSYVYDLHETAIQLHLFCGEPEAARALLDDAVVDDVRRAELSQQISSDIAAKADAAKWMSTAEAHVRNNSLQPALDALTRGHAAFAKDRLLNVNLALALARSGELKRAANLLVEAARGIPHKYVPVCYANAAYCLIASGDVDTALVILNHLSSLLSAGNRGRVSSHPADLPGVAIWVGSSNWTEERLQTANEWIERALASVPEARLPKALIELAAAYREGALAG